MIPLIQSEKSESLSHCHPGGSFNHDNDADVMIMKYNNQLNGENFYVNNGCLALLRIVNCDDQFDSLIK